MKILIMALDSGTIEDFVKKSEYNSRPLLAEGSHSSLGGFMMIEVNDQPVPALDSS